VAGRSDPEAWLPQGGLATSLNLKGNATTSEVVIVSVSFRDMSATSQAAAIRSAPERSFVQVTRLRVKQPPGLRGAESSFLFIVASPIAV